MKETNMKGYKVFDENWRCRGYQYSCPGIFEEDVDPLCCNTGFHFCLKAADCFNYYNFDTKNRVAEVIALGDVDRSSDDTKCCTNKIQIVREIPWQELLELVNTGKDCSGFCNSGNWNSGDWNSGDYNSGDRNSGSQNSGGWNSGDHNSGYCNSGYRNSGDRNSGNWNSGNHNGGDRNSGNWNSGNGNSGYWNSGDWNSGSWNSGNWNSGNWNSGDWNKTYFSNGCFNTEEPKIYLFNKPSEWTFRTWVDSDARRLLNQIPSDVVGWIYSIDMTDEEKKEHPEYETTGGYLKELDRSECGQIWWNELKLDERQTIFDLPNFDAEIFEQCTGIKVGD